MHVFEVVIALLLGGAGHSRSRAALRSAVSRAGRAGRCRARAHPGAPTLVLDPELALALFVAPVLRRRRLRCLAPRPRARTGASVTEPRPRRGRAHDRRGRDRRPAARPGDAVGSRDCTRAPSSRRPTPRPPPPSSSSSARRTGCSSSSKARASSTTRARCSSIASRSARRSPGLRLGMERCPCSSG